MPTVLVTGANRGLGLEFSRQYATQGWHVIACCRSDRDRDELDELASQHAIDVEQLDVSDFAAIDEFAERRNKQPIDLLLNNAGVFGPKAQAEGDFRQTFGSMDYDIWASVLRVNTIAPFKLVEALLANLKLGEQKKVVTISSTMGSIDDTSGGVYAYRSAKCATNMVMASLAKELESDGILFQLLCPGWVSTRMGGEQASVTPEQSVSGMQQRIEEMSADNSGRFVRYNGEAIPW